MQLTFVGLFDGGGVVGTLTGAAVIGAVVGVFVGALVGDGVGFFEGALLGGDWEIHDEKLFFSATWHSYSNLPFSVNTPFQCCCISKTQDVRIRGVQILAAHV
jgi:hypothetical protein